MLDVCAPLLSKVSIAQLRCPGAGISHDGLEPEADWFGGDAFDDIVVVVHDDVGVGDDTDGDVATGVAVSAGISDPSPKVSLPVLRSSPMRFQVALFSPMPLGPERTLNQHGVADVKLSNTGTVALKPGAGCRCPVRLPLPVSTSAVDRSDSVGLGPGTHPRLAKGPKLSRIEEGRVSDHDCVQLTQYGR
ncbi:hypothetical protein VTK26DRAFT_4408 [Humicola hyalothermophila]